MSDQTGEWWATDEQNDAVPTAPSLWRPIADRVGGFDLDPASGCEPVPIADLCYTEADDGLSSPWFGTVWLNPPFSDRAPWYRRLVTQYRHGDVDRAVAVAKPPTSSDWFHDWFADADVITFLSDRDHYLGQGSNPSFSTILGVWNPTNALVAWLDGVGTVTRPLSEGKQTNGQQTTLPEVSDDG